MSSQSADLQLFLNGGWTSVPLLLEQGVKITRGHDPYGTWPRPTELECRINNDSLDYDPSRPAALLYGLASRNTPARIFTNTNRRVHVEAAKWVPDRTSEHVSGGNRGLAWVDLNGMGLLDRIRTWDDPVRSPMYNTITGRSTCIGHWPMEDGKDAQQAGASVGAAAITRGVTFGEDERPQGAASSAKLSATSFLSGRFLPASTTAGWQIAFSFKLDQIPAAGSPYVDLFSWRAANGYSWYWAVADAAYQLRVVDHTGAVLFTGNVGFGTGAGPDQWITARMKVSQVGGNVQVERGWYPQNGQYLYGTTDTFAGSVSVPQQWFQFGSSLVDGGWLSHVFAVTGLTDDLVSGVAVSAFDGYADEYAADRFFRIMAEKGLSGQAFKIGNTSDTQIMGPQPVASLLTILQEIRDTDDCRIDDERFAIGLTMTTRRALYNQVPALSLTYPTDIAIPFRKLIDTTPIKNQVTVKNRDGGEVTWTETTGLASIQPPPAGVGAVPYTQNVNVYNEETQLDQLGSHWLNKLTQPAPRYEEVTVDLLKNPGLAAAVMQVREGNIIRVGGLEFAWDYHYLLVVGIIEQVGPGALWSVTFQCEPGEFWLIGVYDDGFWRWDTRTMTVQGGGITAGATTITTNVSDPNDVLTTAAGSLPVDMVLGVGDGTGELVRVTAVSAAGPGPTYAQTLTVTRAINGVSRAWPAGTQMNIRDAKRWGL